MLTHPINDFETCIPGSWKNNPEIRHHRTAFAAAKELAKDGGFTQLHPEEQRERATQEYGNAAMRSGYCPDFFHMGYFGQQWRWHLESVNSIPESIPRDDFEAYNERMYDATGMVRP